MRLQLAKILTLLTDKSTESERRSHLELRTPDCLRGLLDCSLTFHVHRFPFLPARLYTMCPKNETRVILNVSLLQ